MSALDTILANKRGEVTRLLERSNLVELRRRAQTAPPARDFLKSLANGHRVPIIAEIKRASPSAGQLRSDADVSALARTYETAGAAAISVLTDAAFFGGSIEDLSAVRNATSLPILRKDFILDTVQIYESRIAGADAILLIVAALEADELRRLHKETIALGMTPLVEAHTEAEVKTALSIGPSLMGINNRDLATLDVNLQTCVRLRALVPESIPVVAESGISTPDEVKRLRSAGLDAFLVGIALMRSADPGEALRALAQAEV